LVALEKQLETQQTTSSTASSAGFNLDKYAGKDVSLPNSSLDINSLLRNTNILQATQAGLNTQLQGTLNKAGADTQKAADLNIDLGANAALIEQVKQAGELETQAARDKAAADLGTDYRLQAQKLTGLSAEIASTKARMDEASAKIREKQSVSFLDNPLGWLFNQVAVNGDIKDYNLAEEDSNRAIKQYQAINTLTQSAVTTQNALTHSISEASAKAATDNIALVAQQKQLEGSAKALSYNTEAIKAAYDMGTQRLQYEFSMFSAEKAEQQNKIALAHLQLSKDEAAFRMQDKLKKEGADSDIIATINNGRKIRLGDAAQLIRPGTAEANKIVELVKSNSPLAKEYTDDYFSGERFQASGIKNISPSPADFADMVARKIPINAPGSEPVQQFISDIKDKIVAEAAQSGITKPEVLKNALNQKVEAEVKRMSKTVDWSSKKNLLNLPNYADYIDSPGIKDLPVVQKVIAPVVKSGGDLQDPDKLLAVIANGITSKKITYGEALEATTLIQKGVAINAAQKQFTAFGIVPPRSWNVEITSGNSVFNRTEIVDLTKPDQLGRALIKTQLGAGNFDKLLELNKSGAFKQD
jgi:hypothetical protein